MIYSNCGAYNKDEIEFCKKCSDILPDNVYDFEFSEKSSANENKFSKNVLFVCLNTILNNFNQVKRGTALFCTFFNYRLSRLIKFDAT